MTWIRNNVALVGIVLAFVVLLLVLSQIKSCMNRTQLAKQGEQSVKTSEAFANAVANGVEIADNRVVTEQVIAEATAQVKDEIGDAKSLDAIDAAITAELCASPRHRNDPACRVQ